MNSSINRRHFLSTIGFAALSYQTMPLYASGKYREFIPSETTEHMSDFYIDSRFSKFKSPWRKVHLDFHNSKYVPKIGAKFNADEWGDQLVAGNVDSIVVFAKDMHGYFYYPSKYGPVHPGLSFDLLGEQVKACGKRNIAVYAYYCTSWDNYLADAHPEWNMRKLDGSDYRPKIGEIPGWTALCLGNREFVDLMANHIQEFVSKYELDGAWFDMAEPIAQECYCNDCLHQITASGKDPYNKEVQKAHQNKNFIEFHRRISDLVRGISPSCQVDFNDNGIGKVGERAEFLDSIDIEALPTGGWGYYYAPAQVRYQRNFGIPVYGMTGRFVSSWADFGGLKLPQQLDVELASLVANAARCDVGDQMPPNGHLDAAVYYLLGKSFGRIKQLEPWLNQAAPVTEAALMVPTIAMEKVSQNYICGLVKLMIESHLQFDLVEQSQDWERYKLMIIPDELTPDADTIERLHKYIERGGAVIVCHHAGLDVVTRQSWLNQYGLTYNGESAFEPAYIVTEDGFTNNMPGYAYALYDGASQWSVQASAKSLAMLGVPLFQRSAEHYTSHNQSPFDHVTDYSALAVCGKVALVAFPLGSSYYDKGYWIYRIAFQKLLDAVYSSRLIETNAPLNTEITVTYQSADKEKDRLERYMVHLINWSPSRKTSPHSEVHEDPVPLTNIRVKFTIPTRNLRVKTVVAKQTLEHRISEDVIEITIPHILMHEIVCFEYLSN